MEPGLKRDSKVRSRVLRDLDPRATALARPRSTCTNTFQTPSYHQGGRPTIRKPRMSENNYHGNERKIGHGPQMVAWYQDRLAD
jgi:hypothetical protein